MWRTCATSADLGRPTSAPLLRGMLDAWFAGAPSEDPVDRENVAHVRDIG